MIVLVIVCGLAKRARAPGLAGHVGLGELLDHLAFPVGRLTRRLPWGWVGEQQRSVPRQERWVQVGSQKLDSP